MEKQVPPGIQRLFWDMRLDTHAPKKTIIERVLNNGTLADWRWLVAAYGVDDVRRCMDQRDTFGRTNVRSESRRIALLLLPRAIVNMLH